MSRIAGNPQPDPRQDFLRDLVQFVVDKRSQRPMSVGIFLDANEQLGTEIAGLQTLTATLSLKDVHANLLGNDGPATYLRGQQRLDYALLPDTTSAHS